MALKFSLKVLDISRVGWLVLVYFLRTVLYADTCTVLKIYSYVFPILLSYYYHWAYFVIVLNLSLCFCQGRPSWGDDARCVIEILGGNCNKFGQLILRKIIETVITR